MKEDDNPEQLLKLINLTENVIASYKKLIDSEYEYLHDLRCRLMTEYLKIHVRTSSIISSREETNDKQTTS